MQTLFRTYVPLHISMGLILMGLLFQACTPTPVTPAPTSLISDQVFEEGLKINSHEFDSLIIENCTFHDHPLQISNADHVTVRNCRFEDIGNNGIKVGFLGEAQQVTIENCTFLNIGYNGVDSHEDAPDGTIRQCYFESCGLSDVGAAMGQPHHSIYWKGQNVLIENNVFERGEQEFGNAISHRSSGIIRGNQVHHSNKNGIMYYADHPGGDSLLIENNFLFDNAYSITLASPGNLDWHNEKVVIRFNTLVQESNYSIYVAEPFESSTEVNIYGNLIVNPTENYLRNFFPVDTLRNLTTPDAVGFIDRESGDLHLTNSSPAVGFCTGLSKFPTTDIDGDVRTSSTLDAGADEI